jgi:type I restriction enzyme S subunit
MIRLRDKVTKESGVTWVGPIPEHWKVKRAKFLFSLARREPREEDEIVTAFRDGQVTLRVNRRIDGFTNAFKESGYQGVRKGDLVIHAMDAFAGAIGVSDSDGKCTPVYSCCTPRGEATSEFYAHCVRTMATTGFIESLAKGIRERSTDFRWATFAEQFLPVPPVEEQMEIVDFIDRQISRIDGLIEKKTRFIELLREKRQALITHTVTKGMDAKVSMKDSKVKWLGQIPSHWEVIQSRRIFAERNQKANDGDRQLTASQKYGLIAQSEFVKLEGRRIVQVLTGHDILKHVEAGDFVISMRSFQGGLELSKISGSVSSAYVPIIPGKKIYQGYFRYLFKSSTYIQALQSTSDLVRDGQALRFENFSKVPLPVVPIEEQMKIAAFLDRATSRIDVLIAKTERSIDLLREHRTALITAAVTGKIDLREAA